MSYMFCVVQYAVDMWRCLNVEYYFAGHFGTSWVKHYCTYQRDSKQITMVPFDQKSGRKGGEFIFKFHV